MTRLANHPDRPRASEPPISGWSAHDDHNNEWITTRAWFVMRQIGFRPAQIAQMGTEFNEREDGQ